MLDRKSSEIAPELPFEAVTFKGDSDCGPVALGLDTSHDTIWATVEQMSELFGRKPQTIIHHIQTIFREGELDEASVIRKFRVSGKDGKRYSTAGY